MEEVSLWSYLIKVLAGLLVLGALGFGVVRWAPRFGRLKGSRAVKVLSVTPVGRDLLYLVEMGPTVVAVISSPKGGFEVLHRWDSAEFKGYQVASEAGGDGFEP